MLTRLAIAIAFAMPPGLATLAAAAPRAADTQPYVVYGPWAVVTMLLGGCAYFGRWLLDRFAEQQHEMLTVQRQLVEESRRSREVHERLVGTVERLQTLHEQHEQREQQRYAEWLSVMRGQAGQRE